MIIYSITHIPSGKTYVGATVSKLCTRTKGHRHNARVERLRKASRLAEAIHEFGWNAFDVKVLQSCESLEDMNIAERDWIKKLNTTHPHGYNTREGGRNGRLAASTKIKIGERTAARFAAGWRPSPEQLERSIKAFQQSRWKIDSRGEKNGRAKLTWPDVRAIRRAWEKGGVSQQSLADTYGVTQMAISKIVLGVNWKNDPTDP